MRFDHEPGMRPFLLWLELKIPSSFQRDLLLKKSHKMLIIHARKVGTLILKENSSFLMFFLLMERP